MEIKDIIKSIKQYRPKLENTPVSVLIEASTNHKVLSFNLIKDKKLLEELKKLCNLVLNLHSKNSINRDIFDKEMNKKTNAFRNNEVGDYLEYLLENHFNKNKSQFKIIKRVNSLSAKGYPDIRIETVNKTIFIEVKATSKPYLGSARDFYLTPGGNMDRKIDCDASHILIGFITKEISSGNFNLIGYKIVDISKIKVSLKPEFNTDNLGIYNPKTIIFQKNL